MGEVVKIKHRRPIKINIAFCILLFIFVYVAICSVLYFTKKKVTIYEVNSGSIMRDDIYTGYIIRKEENIRASHSGYLNYFVYEKERVGFGENICCVDNEGDVSKYIKELKDGRSSFESKDIKQINSVVSDFKMKYNDTGFAGTYDFKTELDNRIDMCLNENIMNDLNSYISTKSADRYHIMQTDKTGVIVCGYDGYESITENELKDEHFDKNNYKYTSLIGKENIADGDIAYRLVTSEKWNIYIKLTDEQAKHYEGRSVVKIRFLDDNTTTNADFSIYTNQYGVYGKISLNKYMTNYATERFVDIEIIDENVSGLKIPKESLVEKDFYRISKSVVMKGNDSDNLGVLVKRENEATYVFVEINIYDEDDDNYYIDKKVFEKNDVIVGKEDGITIELTDTKKVKGVYRINKGYAVFRKVEIIDENDDFYIISSKTPYGLSIYDHIVQDSENVKEDEILY